MLGDPIDGIEHAGLDITVREIGHRVAARFVKQQHVFAVGNPPAAELHPHASAQGLREQQCSGMGCGVRK